MPKNRLDQYLLQNNLCSSREKAKNLIIAGCVRVNNQIICKPSFLVKENDTVTIHQSLQQYVSRGGEKLKKAIDFFAIDVKGKVVLDLGSSTGGFVDCLLQHGAHKVYAVDVGYGQLDYTLRINPKVVVMERKNARHLTKQDFVDHIDLITADLSFISIIKVMQTIASIFDYKIDAVLLIKPQFEAQSYQHKKGVVKVPQHHKDILLKVIQNLQILNITIRGLTYSPIKGPKGNIEFLLFCNINSPNNNSIENYKTLIDSCVNEAHQLLE
ncbi:MAG: TlyA family RNA methyltransferase [Spirochaetes bacterium]|nr:TlyA family RNA methyltransferase [Spirochaetota bacterium]